jgi:hypothetical protein
VNPSTMVSLVRLNRAIPSASEFRPHFFFPFLVSSGSLTSKISLSPTEYIWGSDQDSSDLSFFFSSSFVGSVFECIFYNYIKLRTGPLSDK